MSLFIYIFCFLACLTGCMDQQEAYVERPVGDLYNTAMGNMKGGSYSKAAQTFAEVERQHPYSKWAGKAQLMSAYCYYEAKKYDDAIEGFSVFTQLHPGHPDVDYAYYMLGICHYERIPIPERDQQSTEKSYKAFQEILNRFPDSKYARDARFKIDLIRNHLASREMCCGRFYQQQNNPLAAMLRFQNVVKDYQTTHQAPEALYRVVECALSLGLKSDAKSSAAVLGYNYRASPWYQEAYNLIKNEAPDLIA